jgi:hypothetical protein
MVIRVAGGKKFEHEEALGLNQRYPFIFPSITASGGDTWHAYEIS